MALTRSKNHNPFAADQIVRATRTFAWAGGVVKRGEKYRGSDPAVVAGWTAFVGGDTLDHELENPFDVLPPPPEHAPPVSVQGTSIPIHRQVVSTVDLMLPVKWAPGSPGAETNRPPPMVRSMLRSGQICDVLSDTVRENPSWFRWPAREVSPEDITRIERQESGEVI
jgi:hypothetical protein